MTADGKGEDTSVMIHMVMNTVAKYRQEKLRQPRLQGPESISR